MQRIVTSDVCCPCLNKSSFLRFSHIIIAASSPTTASTAAELKDEPRSAPPVFDVVAAAAAVAIGDTLALVAPARLATVVLLELLVDVLVLVEEAVLLMVEVAFATARPAAPTDMVVTFPVFELSVFWYQDMFQASAIVSIFHPLDAIAG